MRSGKLFKTFLFVVSFFLVPLTGWSLEIYPVVGMVSQVRGEVQVDGNPAQEGTEVRSRSRIATLDGKCILMLNEEVVIHLGAQTSIRISKAFLDDQKKLENLDLYLQKGQIRGLYKKKKRKVFKVQTRSATLGVRGTHIVVEASESDGTAPDRFLVVEGEADVEFGTSPLVLEGQSEVKVENTQTERRVTLKENQLVESGEYNRTGGTPPSIVNVGKAETQKLADQVAPPAPSIATEKDLQQVARGEPMVTTLPLPSVKPPGPNFLRFIDKDPVADSAGQATINLTARRIQ